MCDIARIGRFLAEYPAAEHGPAHIVLADANLEDDHLDWCLAYLNAMVHGAPWPDGTLTRSLWYAHPVEELKSTQIFLNELRALPPAERIQPGDRVCRE